jgi:predicted RecA/RadA family phage recombinase
MYKNNQLIKGFKAGTPIGANIAVQFGTDDQTVIAVSTGMLPIGFTTELGITAADIANGNLVDIVISGVAEATTSAPITRGSRLALDGFGQVVMATAGLQQPICGVALASSASAYEVIPVLVSLAGWS